MISRIFIYIFIILYTSCKNNTVETVHKPSEDAIRKSPEITIKDTLPQKDSIKTPPSALHKYADKLNFKEVFDPKKEPSIIIPKKPVQRQMPLPGGVPDKHYIDSIKNARSRK